MTTHFYGLIHIKRQFLAALVGTLIGALALSLGGLVSAAYADGLGLSYTAYRLDGGHSAPVREGEFVQVGEKLLIKIKYLNASQAAAPAGSIVFTLPAGCAYVGANGGGGLAMSVDGGHRFAPLSQLRVSKNGAVRPATGEDVTHLRLALDHPIAPGESGEVSIVAARD